MKKRNGNFLTPEYACKNVSDLLKSKGHHMLPVPETYIGTQHKMLFRCPTCKEERESDYSSVLNRGSQCSCYKEKIKIEKKRLKKLNAPPKVKKVKELKSALDRWNYNNYAQKLYDVMPTLIPYPNTFTYSQQPMKMYCTECNRIVDKRVSDAIKGSGCNNCYGVGFSSKKNAYLYIMKVFLDDYVIAYKIGITNKKPTDRLKHLNKGTELDVRVLYSIEGKGNDIFIMEQDIKNLIPRAYLSKDIFNDGYTETFNPIYLPIVVQYLVIGLH